MVAEAGDGESALARLRRSRSTSSCWTCRCPVLDGMETLRRLRERVA